MRHGTGLLWSGLFTDRSHPPAIIEAFNRRACSAVPWPRMCQTNHFGTARLSRSSVRVHIIIIVIIITLPGQI